MEIPKFSKIHNRFRLNGYFYDRNTLKEVAYNFIMEGDLYETFLGDFILDWLDNSDSIYLSTSISKKNKILVKKQSLVSSAISTGDFLKVSVGDRALHCLPTNYIAGKMMLIRALILGLEIDLISPSKQPFHKNEKIYDFAAMTPIQAFHSIPELGRIKKLIIGGAYLSNALQQALIKAKINAYETYGMMETLSHIAVRKMTDPMSEFKCLPGIYVGQDNRKCLTIDAPRLDIKKLQINEVFLSNFYLPNTIIKSRNSKEFLELIVSNDSLSGSLYLPKKTNQIPILDLDYINLNFSITLLSFQRLNC
mgnify:CR=1 FL=1